MDSHRFSRRVVTHDLSLFTPRSSNLLPWTQMTTKKHRTRCPWNNYANYYNLPAYSRFYSHVTPPLQTIAEESLRGTLEDRGDHSKLYGNELLPTEHRDQSELSRHDHQHHEQCTEKKQYVTNNDGKVSDEYQKSNVDEGILTTRNVRLHDLLTRQRIIQQLSPSSPVDIKELKETFSGSIFEKTEHEKCMPMVRANSQCTVSANVSKECKNNILILDQPINLNRRDSESGGFRNYNPNIASQYPSSNYKWVDLFDSRERLTPGRFRNYWIYSGSSGKDRIEELSRLGREYKIHSIDVDSYKENVFVNAGANLECVDCMNEQTRKPGAICRRCQFARVNRQLADVQKKAYDIYRETGQLAKKVGDTVEVVNYRDDDVRRYRRVRGKKNIKKLFGRIGTRDYVGERRTSAGGYLYHDDYDDDEEFDDDDDDEDLYYWYDDDCLVSKSDLDDFVEDDNESIAVNARKTGGNVKKKKKKITKKQSVRNVKSSSLNSKNEFSHSIISSFPKQLELVRKNSVESWLKKRGVSVSAPNLKSKPKRVVQQYAMNDSKRKTYKSSKHTLHNEG